MATYRNLSLEFWSDPIIRDEFSKDEKLVYLYLLSNPDTNICGCYQIAKSIMELDTKIPWDQLHEILKHMDEFGKIRYSESNREVLVINWYKHNWSTSPLFFSSAQKCMDSIKTPAFKAYISQRLYEVNRAIILRDAEKRKKAGEEIDFDIPEQIQVQIPESEYSISNRYSNSTDTVTDTVGYGYPIDTVSVESNTVSVVKKNTNKEAVLEKNYDAELEEAVLEWLKYKSEKREAYKPTGLRNLLTQVENKASEVGSVAVSNRIREAMASGWKGMNLDTMKPVNGSSQNRLGGLANW